MNSDHGNRAVGHEGCLRCHRPRPSLPLEMPRHPDRQRARLRRLHVVNPAGREEETRGRGRGADAVEGIKRLVEVKSVVCGRHEQHRTADQRRVEFRGLRMPGEGVPVERFGIADDQPFLCFPVTVDAGGIAIKRDDRLQTGIGSGHHPTQITAGRDSIGADPLRVDARVLAEEGHGPAPRRRRAVPEIPPGIRHIARPRRPPFALTENRRTKIGESRPPRQRPLVIKTDADVTPLCPELHRLQARRTAPTMGVEHPRQHRAARGRPAEGMDPRLHPMGDRSGEEELLEVHPILVPGAEQVDLHRIALPVAPGDHLRHRLDRRQGLTGGRLRQAGESRAARHQADHHQGDRKRFPRMHRGAPVGLSGA